MLKYETSYFISQKHKQMYSIYNVLTVSHLCPMQCPPEMFRDVLSLKFSPLQCVLIFWQIIKNQQTFLQPLTLV